MFTGASLAGGGWEWPRNVRTRTSCGGECTQNVGKTVWTAGEPPGVLVKTTRWVQQSARSVHHPSACVNGRMTRPMLARGEGDFGPWRMNEVNIYTYGRMRNTLRSDSRVDENLRSRVREIFQGAGISRRSLSIDVQVNPKRTHNARGGLDQTACPGEYPTFGRNSLVPFCVNVYSGWEIRPWTRPLAWPSTNSSSL